MSLDRMFETINVSGTGLSAERLRMEIVAQNIANASSTRTPTGGPYKRQDLVFQTVLGQQMTGEPPVRRLGGVRVVEILEDRSEHPQVYNPGHPDADADGFVLMPNVHLPIEMVNLLTATRSYEAGIRAVQTFREMAEQALTLARTA